MVILKICLSFAAARNRGKNFEWLWKEEHIRKRQIKYNGLHRQADNSLGPSIFSSVILIGVSIRKLFIWLWVRLLVRWCIDKFVLIVTCVWLDLANEAIFPGTSDKIRPPLIFYKQTFLDTAFFPCPFLCNGDFIVVSQRKLRNHSPADSAQQLNII